MQIEHEPWLPIDEGGIGGQKIAIVGYSHYMDGSDHASFTKETIQAVISGELRHRFFTSIRSYFGFTDDADFWSRVIFFNFIPDAIGPKNEKYAEATPTQLSLGRNRLLSVLHKEKPDKVFVFTSKGWSAFPETTEELSGGSCQPLISGAEEPNWGTYVSGEHTTLVCGFRHPQFAQGGDLKSQVQTFLSM